MRVLLVRHGQTDWNAAARIQGASDVPLNAAGRAQAAELARTLASGERPEALYSSPLSRAMETAEIIGTALGLPVTPAAELTELNFGDWEGSTWEEIGRRWPREFAAYAADRRGYAPPRGESYARMLLRARPFVERLRRAPGGAALCVAHSAVIRGLLAEERGISVGDSYKRIRLPNGVIIPLENLFEEG